MIDSVEDYFTKGCGRCARFAGPQCSTRRWQGGLAALRRVCREAGLEESLRWGHPCYRHAGRNVALIGAFRADFRLTFFGASRLDDTEAMLERRGPNSSVADTVRFRAAAEVESALPALRRYLHAAKDLAEKGPAAPKVPTPLALPLELREILQGDRQLAEAFERLTPGRQRSYAILLSSAKTSQTRIARIARKRAAILAGKGANER